MLLFPPDPCKSQIRNPTPSPASTIFSLRSMAPVIYELFTCYGTPTASNQMSTGGKAAGARS
jgi:hypothetical protein